MPLPRIGYAQTLVFGSGGVLYAVATAGVCLVVLGLPPPIDCGDFFTLSPPAAPGVPWTYDQIYSFPVGSGEPGGFEYPSPYSLVIGSGGVIYSTTNSSDGGTIFSLTPPATAGAQWALATVYTFSSSTSSASHTHSGVAIGSGPNALPVLYVAESTDVAGSSPQWSSEVFSLSPVGPGGVWTKTVLYTTASGEGIIGDLAVGPAGLLYGTAFAPAGDEVFALAPPQASWEPWTKSTLYTFPSGVYLRGELTIGPDNIVYGPTYAQCTPSLSCNGTVFSLTPPGTTGQWTETTLHNFTGGDDGGLPGPMALGSNGTLYGTTQTGGTYGGGTVFSLKVANPGPSINPGGLVTAAGYTAPVAPGSIAYAFGDFFVPVPLSASQSPLPGGLSGLSLQFDSTAPAPLFFVSGGQVNLQVPWELAGQSQASLTATLNGQTGAAQAVNLGTFAPAIFTTNATGTGQGAILDAGNQLVAASNPATPGSTVLQIFCTGLGPVDNHPPTGSPAPSDPLAHTTTTPTVTIGGVAADVSFSGLAPGYVGLYQVNAQVPAGLPTNDATPLVISMPGATSNTVTIAVK